MQKQYCSLEDLLLYHKKVVEAMKEKENVPHVGDTAPTGVHTTTWFDTSEDKSNE